MSVPAANRSAPRSDIAVVIAYALISAGLLASGGKDYPDLHTMLDTGMLLLSGVTAWFLWEAGMRIHAPFPRWVAISFAATSVTELLHVLVSVEWSGRLLAISNAEAVLRPATWPVGAHLLPVGVCCAILLMRRDLQHTSGMALGLVVLSIVLARVFLQLPRYTSPTWLGVTRPGLIFVPCLWIIVAWSCWRIRIWDRVLPAMVPIANGVLRHAGAHSGRAGAGKPK